MASNNELLRVEGLKKYFTHDTSLIDQLIGRNVSYVQAVDNVSFTLDYNESKGIIGESGCGKTTLLYTLLGLYQPTEGSIYFEGEDITQFSRREWKSFRRETQIIFQDPFNSLNPKRTVRGTLEEPLKIHGMSYSTEKIKNILDRVGLEPDRYIDRYPQEMSGGEKQRVAIARALILEPRLLLADEPTSMLDVSTQASILSLLSDLVEERNISMIYISHDLSTVSYVCDEVGVMYLGRLIESGEIGAIIDQPKHPYTRALMNSIPIPDPDATRERTSLEGSPGDPIDLGEGCRFRDRCPERMEICDQTPIDVVTEDGRSVACHLYYDHLTRLNSERPAEEQI